jgi:RNA polymerase sigma-70 factor (ECF subfamily)
VAAPHRAQRRAQRAEAALEARQRSKRRATALEEADEPSAVDLPPPSLLEKKLTLAAVRDAVEKLPAAEREVIALRFKEGLSYEEIGAVTGSGAAALKQKTWRALQRLRAALGAEEESS